MRRKKADGSSTATRKAQLAQAVTVAYRGGVVGSNPPPEIPKALQNRAKLNPIVKTVKNC